MANFCSECGGSLSGAAATAPTPSKSRPTKRVGKPNPKLGRAMKKAYAHSHKKNGDFRKGWDRSKMLKWAHKNK